MTLHLIVLIKVQVFWHARPQNVFHNVASKVNTVHNVLHYGPAVFDRGGLFNIIQYTKEGLPILRVPQTFFNVLGGMHFSGEVVARGRIICLH